jgi:tRNA(Ile)-lysidine synthase
MDLLSRVRDFVRQHNLIGPGTRALAAVSGGSDSVALVYTLHALAEAGELRRVGGAHFNHQLRRSAGDDERFVADLARRLQLPFIADGEDVAARATRERRSLEDAARRARHGFFARARVASGADVVAVGHTRDDQAETVLLRLTRGAGPRGLGGMHPRNGAIVRPLLSCRRQELREWLAQRSHSFVDDESNLDVSIPRNRVRAELMPLLQTRFNPAIVDVLADQAEVSRETWLWMDALASDLDAAIVRRSTTPQGAAVCEIDLSRWSSVPLGLRRALLWRVMSEVGGGRSIGFDHVAAALRLMEERGETRVDFPGHRLERIGGRVVLTGRVAGSAGRPTSDTPSNSFRFPLSIPGEVALPAAGWIVSAQIARSAAARNIDLGGDVAQIRLDRCSGSLAVRNRRPGDRFRPVGLGGRKKLQDYFVDRKVARAHRDAVPLVVDDTDRIVWVAGFGIDEAFRVTDRTQEVIILTLKVLGGSA